MSLEIRIPISPRTDFVNRVGLIAKAARQHYPDCQVRVSVGPGDWGDIRFPEDVHFVFVHPEEYGPWIKTQHPFIPTMMERFRPPFDTTHILMLDADVMPMARIDELFETNAIAAMMAHVAPFDGNTWAVLHETYGAPFGELHLLSGSQIMFPELAWNPAYFNTGTLFAPARLLEQLYEPYMAALEFVRSKMDSYFFEQIALTLALAKTGLPYNVLPPRYNFPNQVGFEQKYPQDLADIRLLHFLRTDTIDREKDFASPETIQRFVLRKDLTGTNEMLRAKVEELL